MISQKALEGVRNLFISFAAKKKSVRHCPHSLSVRINWTDGRIGTDSYDFSSSLSGVSFRVSTPSRFSSYTA
jgi:hypothetical protein